MSDYGDIRSGRPLDADRFARGARKDDPPRPGTDRPYPSRARGTSAGNATGDRHAGGRARDPGGGVDLRRVGNARLGVGCSPKGVPTDLVIRVRESVV